MKIKFILLMLFAVIFQACGPTQKITGSWSDPDAKDSKAYTKIFVAVLTQNQDNNYFLETQTAKTLRSRGFQVVKSNDIYPPSFSPKNDFTKEQLAESITKTGCDGILSIALLDSKIEETYHPGSSYTPMSYGFYGSYYSYYDYYYPQVYSPGYYSLDKTFYVESNFYDLASGKLLWSVQSEASNPKDLQDWYTNYSAMLINHLESKGLNQK